MNKFMQNIYQHIKLNKREIDLVICHVLNINTAALFIYDKEISENKQNEISDYLEQRQQGKPLAYITGTKEFWTLNLKVNEHTLIPRPETEQIIELVLNRENKEFSGKILDLGTGTGAIALTLAQEFPKSKVTAIDFSEECIKIAKYNQKKYNLTNIDIFQSNWFENINEQKFDFIISNPPYIEEGDSHLVDLKYEPITALTAKNEGLADLFLIIEQSKKYLNDNGVIMLEHGFNQKNEVQACLTEFGFNNVKTYLDLAKLPRLTIGTLY